AQTYLPLDAMLNTRVAGQLRQAQSLMHYFRDSARAAGFSVLPVDLTYSSGNDSCLHPPLSWKLTAEQANCVREAAIKTRNVKMRCIRYALTGMVGKEPEGCWTI